MLESMNNNTFEYQRLSKEEMELINNLLSLDGNEIYQKYGYKRDETIYSLERTVMLKQR